MSFSNSIWILLLTLQGSPRFLQRVQGGFSSSIRHLIYESHRIGQDYFICLASHRQKGLVFEYEAVYLELATSNTSGDLASDVGEFPIAK